MPPGLASLVSLDANSTRLLVLVVSIFLFDLLDLQPQIGTFWFLVGSRYWVYLLVRLLLGLLATLIVTASEPGLEPALQGFLAAIGGVVLLQNLALRVAGQDVLNAASLVDNYRVKLIAAEGARVAGSLQLDVQYVTDRLLREVSGETELRQEVQSRLLQAFGGQPESPERVREHLSLIDMKAADDSELRRRTYAALLATDPAAARTFLELRKRARRQTVFRGR